MYRYEHKNAQRFRRAFRANRQRSSVRKSYYYNAMHTWLLFSWKEMRIGNCAAIIRETIHVGCVSHVHGYAGIHVFLRSTHVFNFTRALSLCCAWTARRDHEALDPTDRWHARITDIRLSLMPRNCASKSSASSLDRPNAVRHTHTHAYVYCQGVVPQSHRTSR